MRWVGEPFVVLPIELQTVQEDLNFNKIIQ